MHLIETNDLKLEWFSGKPPPYAILSHTWDSNELSFTDFGDVYKRESHPGFRKIKSTCKQARHDGYHYAWIDTCCINKESSAELSEAINSMFRWYKDAAVCYTYIDDLPDDLDLPITNSSLIRKCRWFSRGWTLQELLAPQNVIFFGPRWDKIGYKADLLDILEEITRVPRAVLAQEVRIAKVSVADRMNWAARRQTTREEDMAHCLMGIFDVNMPMIYGEGGRKAFIRLQEEIIKQSQDDSLFAWRATDEATAKAPYRGLLASSPADFASDVSITPFYTSMAGPTTVRGDGRILLSCALYDGDIIGLKCFQGTDVSRLVGIHVKDTGDQHYLRSNPSSLILRPHKSPAAYDPVLFEEFVERNETKPPKDMYLCDGLHLAKLPQGVRLSAFHPKEYRWQNGNMVPVVYIVNKKVAFEFAIDKDVIGADAFRFVGRNEDRSLGGSGDVRVLLVVCVRPLPASNSYTYDFCLECVGDRTAEASLESAEEPLKVPQRAELHLGWCTLQIHGGLANVDGQMMFSFATSLVVHEDVKAEVQKSEREMKDAQERRAQEQREQDQREREQRQREQRERRQREQEQREREQSAREARAREEGARAERERLQGGPLYPGFNTPRGNGACIDHGLPVLYVFAWLVLGLFMYYNLNKYRKAEP